MGEDPKKEHNRSYKEGSFPTRCTVCDILYSEAQWKALRCLGIGLGRYNDIEYRNCKECESTLCVPLVGQEIKKST